MIVITNRKLPVECSQSPWSSEQQRDRRHLAPPAWPSARLWGVASLTGKLSCSAAALPGGCCGYAPCSARSLALTSLLAVLTPILAIELQAY